MFNTACVGGKNVLIITPSLRPSYCTTCLSSDRTLHSIAPELCTIFNRFALGAEDSICYECKAILNKILKFKQRAVTARIMLKTCKKTDNISNFSQQIKSLSSLTCSPTFNTNNTFDVEFPFYDGDNALKPLQRDEKEYKANNIVKEETIEESICYDKGDLLFEVPTIKCEPQASGQEDTGTGGVLKHKVKHEIEDGDKDDDHFEDEIPASYMCLTVHSAPGPSAQKTEHFRDKRLTETELLEFREAMRNDEIYKRSNYKCETCILGFYKESLLVNHNHTYHEENMGSHVCDICKQRFPYLTNLDVHMAIHYTCYECCRCDFRHHTHKVMKTHVQNLHTEHQCKICKTKFTGSLQLKQHKVTSHRERRECNICRKMLANAASYSTHMRRHRGEIPQAKCDVCQKSFNNKGALKLHMSRMHNDSGAGPVFCEECQIPFKDSHVYRNHLRSSSKHMQAIFECDLCDKRCVTKGEIRNHIERMHVKKQLYGCETCDQKFITMDYLRSHERLQHRGFTVNVKKHVCHECGKKFTKGKALNEHLNTHSGLRPFQCNICGDTFSYSAALYTHNKLKHLKLKRERKKKNTNK